MKPKICKIEKNERLLKINSFSDIQDGGTNDVIWLREIILTSVCVLVDKQCSFHYCIKESWKSYLVAKAKGKYPDDVFMDYLEAKQAFIERSKKIINLI